MTSDPMFDPMFPNPHPFTPEYKGSPTCGYVVSDYVGKCGCKKSNPIHAVVFENCVAYINDAEGARKIGIEVTDKESTIDRRIVIHADCGGTLEKRASKLICQKCETVLATYS